MVAAFFCLRQSKDRARPAERPRKAGKKSCEQQLKSREQQ